MTDRRPLVTTNGVIQELPTGDRLPGGSFQNVAALLASTAPAEGAGTLWRAGPYTYVEAASGASDHHLTTAGGVKLYRLSEPAARSILTPLRVLPYHVGQAQEGNTTQLTAIALLDSLALEPWYGLLPLLEAGIKAERLSGDWGTGLSRTEAFNADVSLDITGSDSSSDDYTTWPFGTGYNFNSGSIFTFQDGGGDVTCEKVYAAAIIQSGGGTAQFVIDSTPTGPTYDLSFGTEGDVVILSYDYGAQTADQPQLTVTGGTMRLVYVWFEDTSVNRINLHTLLSRGGLELSTAMASAQAVANLETVLASACGSNKPLITWAAREGVTADMETHLPVLFDALDTVDAEVIACSETAYGTSTGANALAEANTRVLEREIVRRVAAGKSYAFIDLFTPTAADGQVETGRTFVNAADTDYTDFNDGGAHQGWLGARSIYKPLHDYVTGFIGHDLSPWTTRAAKLGDGTVLQHPDGGDPLRLAVDATFRQDWTLYYGRHLIFQDRNGTDVFRLSKGTSATGSNAHVFPARIAFDSDSSGRYRQFDLSTGKYVLRYYDTGQPHSGLLAEFGAARLTALPSANLSGFSAANLPGTVFNVDYGSGDLRLLFARNSAWERIFHTGGADVPIADGGTGASTAGDARTNLGLGSIATLSAPSGTVVGTSDTQTLTNKRVTPRVSTTTSSATPTINTDNVDVFGLTALATNITSFTTNLSGTPTDGQKLLIYIVGTATRTISWGASFEASTIALPTTTDGTNRLDVAFIWNAATSKWRCVGYV